MSRALLMRRLGIPIADWQALQVLARAAHPAKGMIAGLCICGAPAYQPTPPACRALRDLVDLAELAERQTR